MKYLISAFILFLAFQANANDRTLGNVVAIERELTGVADSCRKTFKESEVTAGRYSCAIHFLKDGEFALKRGSILNHVTSACQVSIDNVNGNLIFFIQSKNSSQPAAALNCMEEAVAKKGQIKVTVFGIQ